MKAPIFDKVMEYRKEAGYPWHMPGHKRGKGVPVDPVWQDIYGFDFTEIPGLDEYHDPEGIIKAAQLEAAQLYGVRNSYFLVNGSTVGILAAMSAACNRGDKVLIARNCHRSVYHGVEMLDLEPYYMYPEWLADWDMYGGVSAVQIEQCLQAHPGIQAVVLTSPTYEGVLSDIEAISDVVHAHGAVLIVDEAHGAHLPFLSKCDEMWQQGLGDGEAEVRWQQSACACGADIVIQSLHKTLPAMTQTAILHRISEQVPEERLFHYLSMYQSTSPSYVFMASMDYAVHFMAAQQDILSEYSRNLNRARKRLRRLSHIRLFEGDELVTTCAKGYDNAKLVLSVKHTGMTGGELADRLSAYGQVVEMAGASYVICMTSVMDSKEAFDGLIEVLEALDVSCFEQFADNKIRAFDSADLPQTKQVMRVAEAYLAEREWRPLAACEGLVAGEYVYVYPPGSPILVPGEQISKKILELIEFDMGIGLNVKGIQDGKLCVVKEVCDK